MSRSLRPLAYAVTTTVVSTGLLVLAVRYGWLGDDVGRGAYFCEAARDGWVKQPANSFSNVGFVVAGLLVAWQAGRRDRLGTALPRYDGLATAYGCVVVLLGPASAAMHATQSDLGGQLDLLSMYLFASFAAAYALARRVGQGRLFFWQVFCLFVAACELVGLYDGGILFVTHAGNLAFTALLLTAVVVEVGLWRRDGPTRTDLRWGGAALGTILLAFAIWNVAKSLWCDPHSLVQGHAVWHLLDAVSAYLLFRFWVSERARPEESTEDRRAARGGRRPPARRPGRR